MTPATNDSLARAIDYLGAVEVAPGKYAVKHGDRWYLAPSADVIEYAHEGSRRNRVFIAATWKVLPAWWMPEQRTCVHVERFGWKDVATTITADLATGEEVPA